MQDDVAIRSQEFAQQAANSVTPYHMASIESFGAAGSAVGQGISRTIERSMMQQRLDMEKMQSAEEVSTLQMRRAQAAEAFSQKALDHLL